MAETPTPGTPPSERPVLSNRERMLVERQRMPEQLPEIRITNFDEVNQGFDELLAIAEAERCINCPNADALCVAGCPVNVDIPRFITYLREGDIRAAAESLLGDNALPCVTGRVCPQETQCEGMCVRGKKGRPVAIGYLERYVADWALTHREQLTTPDHDASGRRVAIIGSGPAGLTAAGQLVRAGHEVTIYEAFHLPGGVLSYGIPEFRLPKDIVGREVDRLVAEGVKIELDAIIGRTWTLHELRAMYDAIFIGVGAGLPVFMNVPGENFKGVYSANEYLTRVNLMGAFRSDSDTPVLHRRRVAVVGGGNVAMDAVRTAHRLGAAEAMIVYRRGREELPARAEEVHHAEQEGIRFEFLTAPVEVLGDEQGWVKGLRCVRMELGEPDDSGRRRPVAVPGSEFVLDCELVIVAIGTRANPLLTASEPDLKVNRAGYIEVDEDGMTSLPGVFAGGDIVRGSATVILAMGDGKRAAAAIERYLQGVAETAAATPPAATATSATASPVAAGAAGRAASGGRAGG